MSWKCPAKRLTLATAPPVSDPEGTTLSTALAYSGLTSQIRCPAVSLMLFAPPPSTFGSLVRAADPVTALVHVEEDVLVVAEVVAVAHRAVELLLGQALGRLATDE